MFTISHFSIARATFHRLPTATKGNLTVEHVNTLLILKQTFLQKLTYAEKCAISETELVGLLYQQLYYRKGFTLSVIADIIKAEEIILSRFCDDSFELDEPNISYGYAA